MTKPLRWGFLGAARIARDAILPALATSGAGRPAAIAARSRERADEIAKEFGIERVYDAYRDVLDDPEIDAIYIGLPNSAHAEWIRAGAAEGKHVLCEKPLALTAAELDGVADIAASKGVLVQEALMVWTHPRWLRTRELIRSGRIGDLLAVQARFGFWSRDPNNIRNRADLGGGGLLDLGMYLVSMARFVLEREPTRALTLVDRDPDFMTDRMASFLLDFPGAQGSFVCSTQIALNQRFIVLGTRGSIEVELPFTPPASSQTRILIASTPTESNQLTEAIEVLDPIDQYATQLVAFADAVAGKRAPAVSFASSIANMRVLDALNASARSGSWESIAGSTTTS
jgi:predicted dehydrogenase